MLDRAEFLMDGPRDSEWNILLAHGAGAPMDSPFMNQIARGLGLNGFRVARFEFEYMKRRRSGGKGGPPDRLPALLECFREAVACYDHPQRLIIGGKSMGGRIASMVADECEVAGLLCLGYPFHPPGKPEKLRTEHLEELQTSTMIIQGTRDSFGSFEELMEYNLSASIVASFIEDGDHSFKPRVRSGRTHEQNMNKAVLEASRFVQSLAQAVG